jgi:alkylated DNA repair dioxygenase AlkB
MVLAWQLSLGGEEPRVAATVPERRELAGGAWVDHAPGWLEGADVVMAELVDRVPWRQRSRRMYDREVDEPRLTAWWKLDDHGAPPPGSTCLPPVLLEARHRLATTYGVAVDSIGANLYRDGADSVAWHGDTVGRSLAEPVVAIVSLGQARPLLLRPKGGGRSLRYELGGGDLLVMGGTCQRTWRHAIPKVAAAGPRIALMFRPVWSAAS